MSGEMPLECHAWCVLNHGIYSKLGVNGFSFWPPTMQFHHSFCRCQVTLKSLQQNVDMQHVVSGHFHCAPVPAAPPSRDLGASFHMWCLGVLAGAGGLSRSLEIMTLSFCVHSRVGSSGFVAVMAVLSSCFGGTSVACTVI